jgi:hypothetical protein
MRTAFCWVIKQRGVVIPYRRLGVTYRSHLRTSRIQKKAANPSTGFTYWRAWAVESVSSVVPASGVHVGLFPVISQRSPYLRFLYCQRPLFASRFISVWYWAATISHSPLFHFYSLVHCSILPISLLFCLLLSSIPHTCVRFVSQPCTLLLATEKH